MSLAYYVKVAGVLAAFAVVLGLALYYSRRFRVQRYSGDIKIVDRFVLNQNVSLLLISAKKKQFFISVGSKDATLLHIFS
ncbi:MAG: hypothetical protein VW378_04070 [bacterium]